MVLLTDKEEEGMMMIMTLIAMEHPNSRGG
jgi:hypothetical protein